MSVGGSLQQQEHDADLRRQWRGRPVRVNGLHLPSVWLGMLGLGAAASLRTT